MNYFPDDELRCKCCGKNLIDKEFLNKLNAMRAFLDFSFPISSGYRCPNHNNEVSHSGYDGPHTTGRAVDIQCSHKKAFEIITNAKNFGFTGIGINQKGAIKNRFIHLDDLVERGNRPRPHIWSY